MNKTQLVIVSVIIIALFVGVKKLIETQGMVALFAVLFIIAMILLVARLINYARLETYE
jgi:hypothetical protein